MTLHESIKAKLINGWTIDRLRQEYHWISESNLMAVINGARTAVRGSGKIIDDDGKIS